MRSFFVRALALAAVLLAQPAFAQSGPEGSLSGYVTD